MRILYGYQNCTYETYNRIMSERNVPVMIADQKYHSLLIKGLAAKGAEVMCCSGLPISREVTSRKIVREKDEREGSAHYHYLTTINLPVIRRLTVFFGTFFWTLRAKKDKNTCAVYDCLNISSAYGMTLACRLRKIPLVSIVTDIPDMQRNSGFMKKLNNRLFKKADAFILLTEQMNARVNPSNKPYIVMEGHVDSEAPEPELRVPYEKETGKKIMMYAGSLKRIYGIGNLVEGFIMADIPDAEFRVYGRGDFKDELLTLCEKYPNVEYLGTRSNAEIVSEEQKVSLLVNPRPVAPEYTKYSFPSKNMEYMVSGTPLLTTRLPGMPPEYEPYVYFIDDESPQGMARVLREILTKPYDERKKKGESAREFVMKNKSNLVQAEKIIGFLTRVFG